MCVFSLSQCLLTNISSINIHHKNFDQGTFYIVESRKEDDAKSKWNEIITRDITTTTTTLSTATLTDTIKENLENKEETTNLVTESDEENEDLEITQDTEVQTT